MTFIHGYLLAGLVLLGVPVIIHLLNRQKPQALPFPAFRFLKLKRTTNRRKMRLQNLLLLLARLLVLALIIFALARPQIIGARTPLSGTQPLHAVFIFDTSLSMDYASGGESRLDECRARAREVLNWLAPESKVLLLDTAEPLPGLTSTEGWLQSRPLIEGRIAALRTRPVVEALPRLVEGGVALLNRIALEETRPQLLVVFSDRTVPSWPIPAGGPRRLVPADSAVQTLFVDVGVEKPRDLAIESIDVQPALAVPGAKVAIRVGVRAIGGDFNTTLNCLFENDPVNDPAQTRRTVKLGDGQRQVFTFTRTVPPRAEGTPQGPLQVVARFDSSDPLAFNNSATTTVPGRDQRKLLIVTVADSVLAAKPVRLALETIAADRPAETFAVSLLSRAKAAELELPALQENAVVILHQVTQPGPNLWNKLTAYVEAGGGLVIIPPGDELGNHREAFNTEGKRLLPATLEKITLVPLGQPGVSWRDFSSRHPLTAPLRAHFKTSQAQVVSYWEVDAKGNEVIATYAVVAKESPALVERRVGRGRVILFTTPLDGRMLLDGRSANDYWKGSAFGLMLLDLTCQDLAGRLSLPSLRFPRGQEVRLPLPFPTPTPPFKLTGPGLSDSETRIAWVAPPNAGTPGVPLPDLILSQATTAGNFQVRDSKDRIFAAFSLTEPLDESNLERVSVESIEAALGANTVKPVGHGLKVEQVIGEALAPPLELLPLLLLALLLFLVAESWLANRYYKPDPVRDDAAANLRPTGEMTRSRV